jgi:glutamine kinase
MKAIILSAERGIRRIDANKSYPFVLKEDPHGKRIIEWLSVSLHKCGIRDVIIVGGYHIEKIIQEYPQFKYYYNSNWKESGSLSSLFCAENELNGPCLISNSNVVYHSHVVDKLISTEGDVIVGVVPKATFGPYSRDISESEDIFLKDGDLISPSYQHSSSEDSFLFSGLIFFTERGMRSFIEKSNAMFHTESLKELSSSGNHDYNEVLDLLIKLTDSDFQIKASVIDDGLAWIDDSFTFSKFVLGTKAQTLENLRGKLRYSNVLEQIQFTCEQWEEQSDQILKEIRNRFEDEKIIIRSSAIEEDSWTQSHAGKFLSEVASKASDTTSVKNSVASVIHCFERNGQNRQNQIFVQPFLKNVILSGVLFTKDLETGAPYLVINYDKRAGETNGVTSGAVDNLCTYYFYKKTTPHDSEENYLKLIKMTFELERLIGHDALDIEFAIDKSGECYLFQVRPMIFKNKKLVIDDRDFDEEIDLVKRSLNGLFKNRPFLSGKTTIFANMPDWNPAEMIGVSPRPLALSLYKYLITDYVWAKARAASGYRDVYPNPLMFSFAGHPYIDVRTSFNSFFPAQLTPQLSEKLINHYLERLKEHPEFHDKVEFEIAITCFTFDFDFHSERLLKDGFKTSEIKLFEHSLLKLTNDIIASRKATIPEQLTLIQELKERTKFISGVKFQEIEEVPPIIGYFLDDCIRYGTLPFSILARYAFIATTFLKSFQRLNIISHNEMEQFLMSIPTVATEMSQNLFLLNQGVISRNEFLEKFGHLRPGTYDILSPRYDEAFEIYFSNGQRKNVSFEETNWKENLPEDFPSLIFMEKKEQITRLLKESGLEFSPEILLQFIVQSIQHRELAKFEFTKHVSSVLRLLGVFGEKLGLTKEDISYLPIKEVLDFKNRNSTCSFKRDLLRIIESNKKLHKITQAIRLPNLILSADDVDSFHIQGELPNFITNKKVTGPVFNLDSFSGKKDFTGKIVIIEKADPGYDWIFGHRIAGLITKYGGVASHMAIRAAEFGFPAAIGCGELIFNQLIKAKMVELNCSTRQIHVIE